MKTKLMYINFVILDLMTVSNTEIPTKFNPTMIVLLHPLPPASLIFLLSLLIGR